MRSKWMIWVLVAMVMLLGSCYNKAGNNDAIANYTKHQIDSLSFYGTHHYTNNYNFLVKCDSLQMLSQQPEEMLSDLSIDTFHVYKHDLLVVADIRIMETDSIDSVWVQVAKDQETFGWIHESDLLDNVVPDDPISQFIDVFSNIHLILFLVFAILVGFAYIMRRLIKGNVKIKMPFFNDIESFYPQMLCIIVAFSASFYATLQMFAPELWQHFYFNPTLNPFSVPFPLNLFLASAWIMVVWGIATVEDVMRHLSFVETLLYLCVLAVFCALNYVVFSISTLYYIGYPLLAIYVFILVGHYVKRSYKPYICGNCGSQLKKKGRCPYCGTINT